MEPANTNSSDKSSAIANKDCCPEKKLEQYKDLFILWDTNAKIAEQTGLQKEFEREEDEACNATGLMKTNCKRLN